MLKENIIVEIDKVIGKTLDGRKRRELGEDVARIYANAERERFFKGFDAVGRKINYNYSEDYRKEKSKFVKGKGAMYRERQSDIVAQYKATKVNNYGRLTGSLAESIMVRSVSVSTPLFRRRASINLEMTIDDISIASEYAEIVDEKMQFFGFMYGQKRLPPKFERAFQRITRKYFA